MNRLVGKVALVTGAGQGIGGAIVRAFAEEGARVLALDVVPAHAPFYADQPVEA